MSRPNYGTLTLSFFFVVIFATITAHAAGNDDIWSRIDGATLSRSAVERASTPDRFVAFTLNKAGLKQVLAQAPEEFKDGSETILTLPMPDGTLNRFRIEHSLVVEPGLLDKFPELGATYRGQGVDDPTATVRFDLMPNGFHAMILSTKGTFYVDPYSAWENDTYIAYEKTALPAPKDPFICHVNDGDKDLSSKLRTDNYEVFTPDEDQTAPNVVSGTTLRTYRLALAATGEYTAFTGGTVASALAAQVISMNRVNSIYERELAIHMNIIANNNLIIYTDANTDPYTNGNGQTMLGQNQTNLNTVIGSANYDIGHVFSTGGGGVAQLYGPCGSSKAQGVTGSSAPVGDGYDVDYVAHEMGHQWGANHTFNGTVGSCGGGNRSMSNAYEPGSGITIMAYAGICGNQDLALHSIDTFHVRSLNEIVAYSQTGNGNTCAVTTATGNTPPIAPTLGGPYNVPAQTPFSLTASTTDVNGDALTYDWQEYDLGGSTTAVPNTDSDGTARPLFTPYLPTVSGTRYFPSLTYILNNANVPPATFNCGRATPCLTGELLSTMNRTMNFQVIVRDNRASGGGINTATAQVVVTNNSGPFLVTAPNTAQTLSGGGPLNVTWQVADSNLAPVNAANVDILLSTDGGLTFPTVLASATPNDGSQTVTLPDVSTTTARIKIQGSGKIFFDISDADLTITASSVTVSGRIFGLAGRGVRNATVTLTPQTGTPLVVMTGPFGQYSFASVAGGQTYTVSVAARRFTYSPQIMAINGDLTNLDFTPNP